MSFHHRVLPRVGSVRARPSDGQALGLVLCAIAFIALVAVGVSRFGLRLIEHAQAQTAADAAALAGVEGGSTAAHSVAAANGATVVQWVQGLDVFTVTVRFGTSTATAKASREPIDPGRAPAQASAPPTLLFRGQQRPQPQQRPEWVLSLRAPDGPVVGNPVTVANWCRECC